MTVHPRTRKEPVVLFAPVPNATIIKLFCATMPFFDPTSMIDAPVAVPASPVGSTLVGMRETNELLVWFVVRAFRQGWEIVSMRMGHPLSSAQPRKLSPGYPGNACPAD